MSPLKRRCNASTGVISLPYAPVGAGFQKPRAGRTADRGTANRQRTKANRAMATKRKDADARERNMNGGRNSVDSEEGLLALRLLALLRDLIATHGRVRAAKVLRVSYRTLARAADSGRLTGRMSDALERHLLLGGGSHAAEVQSRLEEAEQRLRALEDRSAKAEESAGEAWGGLRDDTARALALLEARLSALEPEEEPSGQGGYAGSAADGNRGAFIPDLVVPERDSGDVKIHRPWSDSVSAWRRTLAEFEKSEDRVAKLMSEQSLLEIEIELIGVFGLTLPPADYPWNRFELASEERRRKRRLTIVRSELARARLRRTLCRIFTFGAG